MAPAFAQATLELEPHFRLAKVDTESNPELAARFGIRSIPTIVIFKNGREVSRKSGAQDIASLKHWLTTA